MSKSKSWYLKIRVKATIITLLLVIILAYLGTWQLGRSMEKKELFIEMQQKINGMPISLSTIPEPGLIKNRFTPALIYGTYLNKYTFLLDNQVFNNKVGYRVLTVIQSPNLEKWLLVDRGWVSQGPSRKILPNIRDIYGLQELIGIINTIPTGIVLHKDEVNPEPTWPIVIQSLDFDFISTNLHHPVYNFVFQLRAEDPASYPMPPVDFGVPSDKHLAYALQWYGFALLVVIYYFITSVSRPKW